MPRIETAEAMIITCNGIDVRVAPASLEKHGLTNGQTLTREQWDEICTKLAIEWIEYVDQQSAEDAK